MTTNEFDLVAHLRRQKAFSEKTFGPGARTAGVADHITKELDEIRADPTDIKEWVDVIILAFDGAWRAGWEPEAIVEALVAKQAKNEARTWPDWRTADPDKAIEHDRTAEPISMHMDGATEGLKFFKPDQNPRLIIYGNGLKPIVTLHLDTGTFDLGEGISADEASQAFARSLLAQYGPSPDFCSEFDEGEYSVSWDERDDLLDGPEGNTVVRIDTYHAGAPRWGVWHETPTVNAKVWYDSEEAALAAIAELADKPLTGG